MRNVGGTFLQTPNARPPGVDARDCNLRLQILRFCQPDALSSVDRGTQARSAVGNTTFWPAEEPRETILIIRAEGYFAFETTNSSSSSLPRFSDQTNSRLKAMPPTVNCAGPMSPVPADQLTICSPVPPLTLKS
jgi:hypothetical protein